MVVADITFASGAATVTAKSLGLNVITGFVAGQWGVTALHLGTIHASTAWTAAGVTSLALKSKEMQGSDTDASDLDQTVQVLFIGK
jgi:hypothetical protein